MCEEFTEEYERNVMLNDLHLAAELGKTLLERNRELETALKQHQNVIEDQAQEIEYLTKQTVALREVNDSRLRIYEQLEVSIQDLERANHRLVLENAAEKKTIKNLNLNVDTLETKVEELQTTIDDLKIQLDTLKRKSQKPSSKDDPSTPSPRSTLPPDEVDSSKPSTQHNEERVDSLNSLTSNTSKHSDAVPQRSEEDMEQIAQLLAQLSKARSQCGRDERRIAELEEQLATLVQQNQALENQVVQLAHKDDDLNMKSIHEELTTLEEVRKGQLCSRCLRSAEQNDDEAMENDDSSMTESLMTPQFHSSFSMDVQDKHLAEILQRDLSMSITWISPTMNLLSVLFDFCLYLKDTLLFPLLSKSFKIPFVLFHYCLKHKLQ